MNRFYPEELTQKPEFLYKNHLIHLKETEIELLAESLTQREAEQKQRAELGSAQDSVAGGKGKDAKGKDAKAAKPGKGGAADEKNAPKAIEVEYPEIESEADFLILEHSFI